jgi:hypothetical protein
LVEILGSDHLQQRPEQLDIGPFRHPRDVDYCQRDERQPGVAALLVPDRPPAIAQQVDEARRQPPNCRSPGPC